MRPVSWSTVRKQASEKLEKRRGAWCRSELIFFLVVYRTAPPCQPTERLEETILASSFLVTKAMIYTVLMGTIRSDPRRLT